MNIQYDIAYKINDKEFESLSNSLAENITGEEMLSFSSGRDGGIDGKKISFANLSNWKSNFIVQAKHTSSSDATCSSGDFFGNKYSIVRLEVERLNNGFNKNKIGAYILFTNRRCSANKHQEIREYISRETKIKIDRIELIGLENIIEFLKKPVNKDILERFFNVSYKEKISLDINNKGIFLPEISEDEFYEPRLLSFEDNNPNYIHLNELSKLSLEEIARDEDKIVLLGSPGIGKSSELKHFALSIWKEGEQDSYVPIYRNLRTFTSAHTFDNYLPKEWLSLDKIYLILDGIDEIANQEDFISKLDSFLVNNLNKRIKIILSIRRTVFDNLKNSLSSYKTYELSGLSPTACLKLFKNKYGLYFKDGIPYEHFEVVQNPFMLNLYAVYYKKHNKFPSNLGMLWSEYINSRFENDKYEKYKKYETYDLSKLKNQCKKIAAINELMLKNEISKKDLEQCFKSEKELDSFLKFNPFIEKNIQTGNYFFEHRNIQEFFFAQFLADIKLEDIIQIISVNIAPNNCIKEILKKLKINSINLEKFKINRKLINSISYLFVTLEESKLNKFTEWILTHEPDILFLSESNNTSDKTKIEVFHKYFNERCVNQKLWLNTREYKKDVLAKFANCIENYNYLLVHLKNESNHYRVRVSSLDILSLMPISQNYKEELKQTFKEILSEESLNSTLKSEILKSVNTLNLYNDNQFLKWIFKKFENDDSAETNHRLLRIIAQFDEVDEFIEFLDVEFQREIGLIEREIKPTYNIGVDYLYTDLLSKINISENFLKIIKHLFNDIHYSFHKPLHLNSKIVIEKLKSFQEKNIDFIDEFFKASGCFEKYFTNQKELVDIIHKTKTNNFYIKKILENDNFKLIYNHLIDLISDEENLNVVIDYFEKQGFIEKQHEYILNRLSTKDHALAFKFNEALVSFGYTFETKLLSEIEKSEELIKVKNEIQSNFSLLFEKEKLIEECLKIFNNLDKNKPIVNQLYDARSNYWSYNYILYSNVTYSILQEYFVSDEDSKNINDLEEFLTEDRLINIIQGKVLSSKYDDFLTETIVVYIKNWCLKVEKEIDFNKVLIKKGNNNFYKEEWFGKLKTCLKLSNKINHHLSESFLLNSIQFSSNNFSENFDEFDFIKSQLEIGDFENKIVENIKEDKVNILSIDAHIEYALNSHLHEALPAIKNHILKDKDLCNRDYLTKIYEMDNQDVEFFKNCCSDISSRLCWYAIETLNNFEHPENSDFTRNIALKYIREDDTGTYLNSAFKVLFNQNYENVFKLYLNMLIDKNTEFSSIRISGYEKYNNIKGLENFSELYYYSFYENKDKWSECQYITNSYIENLAKSKKNYLRIKKVLNEIKKQIIKEKSDIFDINQSIVNAEKIYVDSFSKELSFEKAFKKVNQYS